MDRASLNEKKAKNKREKINKENKFCKKVNLFALCHGRRRHPRVSLVYVVFRRKIIWHLSQHKTISTPLWTT